MTQTTIKADPIGSTFVVNSTLPGTQSLPAAAALASGKFIIVWQDNSVQGDSEIRARFVDSDGQPLGGDIAVNTYTPGNQISPVVTALAGGGFVVTWYDTVFFDDFLTTSRVHAQLFDANGAKIGGEILKQGDVKWPEIGGLADGGFVLTYRFNDSVHAAWPTLAQIFNADGSARSGVFQVNSFGTGSQADGFGRPAIAGLANGDFVIAWSDRGTSLADQSGSAVYGQIFHSDGVKVGTPFLVNPPAAGDQSNVHVSALTGGGFVIDWFDWDQNSGHGQLFDAAGAKVNGPFGTGVIGTAALPGNRFVAASVAGGAETLTVYDSAGNAMGPASAAFNVGSLGRLAANAQGEILATWTTMMPSDTNQGDAVAQLAIVAQHGTPADDVLTGTEASDTVYGEEGNDTITGLGGGDTLDGGSGNDTLVGNAGSDTLIGGGGVDTVDYSQESGGYVVVNLSDVGVAEFPAAIAAAHQARDRSGTYDSLSEIENVKTGSGNDYVYGDSAANRIETGAGNDRLTGGGGADTLIGGTGDDVYIVRAADNAGFEDTIVESTGEGSDEIQTDMAAFSLAGFADIERLRGLGTTGQTLTGNGLDNILSGGTGADTLQGGAGNDMIAGGAGADTAEFVLASPAEGELRIIPAPWGGDIRDFNVEQLVTTQYPGYSETRLAATLTVRFSGDTVTVTGFLGAASLGTDTLTSIEALRFSIDGVSGSTVEVNPLATLLGTPGNDVIDGTAGRDAIDALAGNDRVDGGSGSDTIRGGDGDDILIMGSGSDNVSGGAGDDILYIGPNFGFDDVIDGGSGVDQVVLQGGGGFGVGGGGTPSPFTAVERVVLLTTTDTTYGPAVAGNDRYSLQFYSDAVVAAGATMTFDGSALTDTFWFIGEGETDGGYVVLGGSGADQFRGGGGNDDLSGGGGNDKIEALGGDDRLAGGSGNDSLDGGDGRDTASYADAAGAVTVSLAAVGQQDTLGAGLDTLQAIENLIGSAHDDSLTGDGGDNLLDGGAGADNLTGGAGNDVYGVDDAGDVVTELGGDGIDAVRTALGTLASLYVLPANVENFVALSNGGQAAAGNGLDNAFTMGGGNDVIDLSAGGNDFVAANGGNDYVYLGAALTAADSIDGGAGTDTVALLGTYDLTLGAGTLVGVETLSLLSGTAGGGTTHVTYSIVIDDANVPAGGQLTVYASGLLADETLLFNGTAETNGVLTVYGGAGNDIFAGGPANDTFVGGGGNDLLVGLGGNDWLEGDAGADTLRGGFGSDLFVYKSASDSPTGGMDHILDFEDTTDLINLQGIDANVNAGGDQAFTFIGADAFHGTAGELRVYQSGADFIVEGDTDGDGTADFAIQVTTVTGYGLDAPDFML